MNAKQLRNGSENVQLANKNSEWWLIIGVLVAAGLILSLAGPGGLAETTSGATIKAAPGSVMPAVINNHLYVPCSVSSCAPAPAVINNHLYVPCSVSMCAPAPAVMNNHLYVPCSVSMCAATPGTLEHPRAGGTK